MGLWTCVGTPAPAFKAGSISDGSKAVAEGQLGLEASQAARHACLKRPLLPCCPRRSSSLPCGPRSERCCDWRQQTPQAGRRCRTLPRLVDASPWLPPGCCLKQQPVDMPATVASASAPACLAAGRLAARALALPTHLPRRGPLPLSHLQYLRSKSRAGVVALPATQPAPPARPLQRTLYLVPPSREVCAQLGAPWEAAAEGMLALVVPLAPR